MRVDPDSTQPQKTEPGFGEPYTDLMRDRIALQIVLLMVANEGEALHWFMPCAEEEPGVSV